MNFHEVRLCYVKFHRTSWDSDSHSSKKQLQRTYKDNLHVKRCNVQWLKATYQILFTSFKWLFWSYKWLFWSYKWLFSSNKWLFTSNKWLITSNKYLFYKSPKNIIGSITSFEGGSKRSFFGSSNSIFDEKLKISHSLTDYWNLGRTNS